MMTLDALKGRSPKDATDEDVIEALKKPFNLNKPHKRVVTQDKVIIIQNGMVYEEGSGNKLGTTEQMLQPSNGILMVPETGATFPDTAIGRIRMEKYKERNNIGQKPKDPSKVEVKESTLEERQAEIKTVKSGKVK